MEKPVDWSDKRLLELLDVLCERANVNRKVQAREDKEDLRSDVLRRLSAEVGPAATQPLAVWEDYLRKTFDSALKDLHRRHLAAKKRNVDREIREDAFAPGNSPDSANGLQGLLPAGDTSPTQRALINEELEQLEAAIDRLPQDQQQAIRLHLKGMVLSQIATVMGKTHHAVSGLLRRATLALADELI